MTMHLTKEEVLQLAKPFEEREEIGQAYCHIMYRGDYRQFAEDIIAANEKKRGTITVTKDEFGVVVAVTRTDDEGKILEVIAEGTTGKEIESDTNYYRNL